MSDSKISDGFKVYFTNWSTNFDTGETSYSHEENVFADWTSLRSSLIHLAEMQDGETGTNVDFIILYVDGEMVRYIRPQDLDYVSLGEEEKALEEEQEELKHREKEFQEQVESSCDDCTNFTPEQWRENQRGENK